MLTLTNVTLSVKKIHNIFSILCYLEMIIIIMWNNYNNLIIIIWNNLFIHFDKNKLMCSVTL